VLRDVGADRFVGEAEDLPEQAGALGGQPEVRVHRPVGEGHHPHAVVGRQEDLGVEAGKRALVLDGCAAAEIDAKEGEAEARDPRVGLVLGREHARQGGRPEHRALVVRAATQQRGHVARHVPWRRADRGGSRRHHLPLGDPRPPRPNS
jgi:hypothetical protein